MNISYSAKSKIQPDSLYDQVASLVARAEISIRSEGLDKEFADKLLSSILSAAERADSAETINAAIQQMIQDIEKLQAILRDLLKGFEAWQASQTRAQSDSEGWWQQQSIELYNAFKLDPWQGTVQWLQAYADALLRWDLDVCDKLVAWGFPFPLEATEVPVLFIEGTQALQFENYLNALKMLDYLIATTSPIDSQPLLDQISQALILVLNGRIHLYYGSNSREGLKKFEQAKELAPRDGRIYAALGDHYRALGDWRQARLHYQEGIQLSSDEPDGYLGMGLLSDNQKLWDEALNWYRQAVQTTLAKFSTTPHTDNRMELIDNEFFDAEDSKRTLLYLMSTVNLESKDKIDYRTGVYGRLLGILLETRRKANEAAQAYYQSGQIFMQSNEIQAAIDLFAHANNLDDKYAPTYWSLADAWRVRSPLDKEGLNKSQGFWERGVAIEFPDISHSWAYVTRALINQQQTQLPDGQKEGLLWEGISFLERAILLEGEEPYRWAYLSDFHLDLQFRYNALHASDKALEISADDPVSLQKRASALINFGDLTQAEEVIDRILKSEPNNLTSQFLKSYILYHRREYEAALKHLNAVYESPLQIAPVLILRALCYESLYQPKLAAQDYESIWSRRDPSSNDAFVGWAAYKLDKLNEAIEIFDKLRHHPSQAGNAYRNLGIIYLQRGDMVRGEQELLQGIGLAVNVQELDELLHVDISLLEKILEKSPFGTNAGQVLDRIKLKIKTRRLELDKPVPDKEQVAKAAEQELVKKLEESNGEDRTEDWSWVGARAGLARLYAESKQLELAANEYITLLERDSHDAVKRCPEAQIGLSNVARKYTQLALKAAEQGDLPGTVTNFRSSVDLRKHAGISSSALDMVSESAGLINSTEQYDILKKVMLELDSDSIS